MMLIMVSMVTKADVKVLFGEKGESTFKNDAGTIEVKQDVSKKDATKITVYLIVTPNKGYTMQEKNTIEAYATVPANINPTRALEVSDKLTLDCKDFKDEYSTRTYYVDIDPTLALWVKNATFEQNKRDDSKAVGDTAPEYYYIANYKSYNANDHTKSYYICPAINPDNTSQAEYYDTDMPFLTTYKTNQNDESLWMVKWVKDEGGKKYYNIIHSKDGYYLIYNPVVTPSNDSRLRVHIQLTSTNDDNALFEIMAKDSYYFIHPKNDINRSLNPSKGNKDSYVATNDTPVDGRNIGGMLGLWEDNDDGKWYLESPASSITAAPVVTNNFDGTITITAAEGNIYYTTDRTTAPTTSLTPYSSPCVINLTDNVTFIRAIAMVDGKERSAMINYALPKCEKPVITESDGIVTIVCATTGAEIYYTTDGTDPSDPDNSPTKYLSSFSLSESSPAVRAIAIGGGYITSEESYYTHPAIVHNSSAMTVMNGNYKLASDFVISRSIGTESDPFCGIIDGELNTVSGAQYPLVAYADGATIKNVILDNVSISDGTNVGAICNEATGDTRIYNCGVLSGSVGGSNKVGGIIGLLDGNSRVINCYNYANITSGSDCGGIVGYNKVASTSGNLKTMVMNCMFYGDITGGNPAPIYGGEIIHNKPVANNSGNTGLNNYNYYLYKDQSYLSSINSYDIARGALGAEERFLNRFEFFRLTLNSTRNMAAFYVCGDATQRDIIAKWVLDKSIAPYPILKKQDYYPSIINPDAESATQINLTDENDRNKGRKFGSLTVKITSVGSGARFSAPAGAHLVDEEGNEVSSRTLTLNITDKDFENYNFNYKKIQLPYYNEVGIGNYTKASATDVTGRVVTGWKIVKINDSETGSGTFTGSGSEVTFDDSGNITSTPFNFVDRTCTNKDLYGVSNRVFNQGAYWEVPDEVTSITIEPYWAKCTYLSDANYDVTYDGSTKYGVTVAGSFSKPTALGNQTVYNSVSNAFSNLGSNASHTVYDYAIVLVGNYHQYGESAAILNDGNNKPVTFMSADLDGDCEPDNTLFYYQNNRRQVSPIRFDFLNIPGIGTVKRTWDSGMSPQPGIFKPKGWFEITNTVVVRFGQFEYANASKTIEAPLILQGGIYEQFVSGQASAAQNTNYLLIGGNVWFNTFANGCHTEKFFHTPKVPINVTGGEYKKFYLSGIYQATGTPTAEGAECYIDGGKFEEVAGSGMQKINGNVTWFVNGADITKFYGGGTNAAQPITGNIRTTISNSHVDEFYGGPKFGDVASNKTVVTKADDCYFGKFYGAGYGGTAFNRFDAENVQISNTENTAPWSTYVSTHYGRQYNSDTNKKGISTNYEYEYILHSDGSRTVARFFVNYASLSLASTRNVTSNLNDCVIGAVNGDVNSTLTDCHVTGSAFGAGFSAEAPTVDVWPIENLTPAPEYNRVAGVFNDASVQFPTGVEYTWKHAESVSAGSEFNETGGHYILTTVNLDGLGAVNGNATLNLKGGTIIDGNVYGGGDSSPVNGSTTVNIKP